MLAKQPRTGSVGELRVRLILEEILGGELGGQLLEARLRGGTLHVATANPALAHQLRLDAAAVVERINAANPGRRVRELRVRIGRS